MSDLNLDIHNFGPINHANIELKKLNIIAGANGSGKTTTSKLLYCLLESNSDEGHYLANKSIYERFKTIIENLKIKLNNDSQTLSKLDKLSDNIPKSDDKNFNTLIKTCTDKLKIIIEESEIKDMDKYLGQISDIENALNMNSNERRKFFSVSNTLLRSEFNIRDLKMDENTQVHFYGKDSAFSYKLDLNSSRIGFNVNGSNLNSLNIKNVIYVDSIPAFDVRNLSKISNLKNPPYHSRVLSRNLIFTKDNYDVYDSLFNKKLDACNEKIISLMGGYIYYDIDKDEFLFKTAHGEYHMKNTASGVKQMGIIQILLSNRILNKDSFLIMDEPEVNIHPEWQMKLAEILVLLVKDLNVNLFINTHSAEFIEAIEVYSTKYYLKNETKYYLSEKDENTEKYNVKHISQDKLYEIYNNLGDSYDILDRVRGKNIAHNL